MNETDLKKLRAKLYGFVFSQIPVLINVLVISWVAAYTWDKGLKWFAIYCLIVFWFEMNALIKSRRF